MFMQYDASVYINCFHLREVFRQWRDLVSGIYRSWYLLTFCLNNEYIFCIDVVGVNTYP